MNDNSNMMSVRSFSSTLASSSSSLPPTCAKTTPTTTTYVVYNVVGVILKNYLFITSQRDSPSRIYRKSRLYVVVVILTIYLFVTSHQTISKYYYFYSSTTVNKTTENTSNDCDECGSPSRITPRQGKDRYHHVLNLFDQLLIKENITLPTATTIQQDQQRQLPTIAICHRTMFGNQLEWNRIKEWFVYYRLLGVDKFFLGYVPDLANTTMIQELSKLPYVDMWLDCKTELAYYNNTDGEITVEPKRKAEKGMQSWGQADDEEECTRRRVGTKFDWVLTIDYDEFLWFDRPTNLKEFVYQQQHVHKYTYLSFGKYMYDTLHRQQQLLPPPPPNNINNTETSPAIHDSDTSADLNLFEFEKFPWTPGPYCRAKKAEKDRGKVNCPTHLGRSKVMVKTPHHGKIQIHGSINKERGKRFKHFDSKHVHFKEWGNYHLKLFGSKANHKNTANNSIKTSSATTPLPVNDDCLTTVPRYQNFTAKYRNETGIHDFEKSHKFADSNHSSINVYYDGDQLQDWLRFLMKDYVVAK